MNSLLAMVHAASPLQVLSVSLLALQVSVLVLTGGIFTMVMLSAYDSLSLMRRTLSDIANVLRRLEEETGGTKTRSWK